MENEIDHRIESVFNIKRVSGSGKVTEEWFISTSLNYLAKVDLNEMGSSISIIVWPRVLRNEVFELTIGEHYFLAKEINFV